MLPHSPKLHRPNWLHWTEALRSDIPQSTSPDLPDRKFENALERKIIASSGCRGITTTVVCLRGAHLRVRLQTWPKRRRDGLPYGKSLGKKNHSPRPQRHFHGRRVSRSERGVRQSARGARQYCLLA